MIREECAAMLLRSARMNVRSLWVPRILGARQGFVTGVPLDPFPTSRVTPSSNPPLANNGKECRMFGAPSKVPAGIPVEASP